MRRGFTIAETLVVAVILGMMLTAIVGAVAPLFSAPDRAQAKTDTLGGVATGMYVMQRDIRESDANGIFACTEQPIVCGDAAVGRPEAAIAVATALGSSGLNASFSVDDHGAPNWQGFVVYWQSRITGNVYRTFESDTGIATLMSPPVRRTLLSARAADAVATAMRSSAPAIAMRGVGSLTCTVDPSSSDVTLRLVAIGGANDYHNSSAFDTEIFTRN